MKTLATLRLINNILWLAACIGGISLAGGWAAEKASTLLLRRP